MGKEIITFGNTEVEKHNFHEYNIPISIYGVDISIRVISKRVPSGEKGFTLFIWYENGKNVETFMRNASKMSACGREFDETKKCLI